MKRNELLVLYGENIRRMTSRILQEARLCDLIPGPDTLIGIKPNLVGQVLAQDGATTHPEIVEELILYLHSHGFRRIVVLESSWVGDCTKEALEYCGYSKMLQRRGVPFWDMQEDKSVSRDCAGMTLNLCRRALDIEFLINVPVLKGHCQTRMTCALKNMKGLIPSSEKRRFHRMGLHAPIAHLNAFLHQDFILVDSICGDLTFEDGGNPVLQNRLIAGLDPVLVDTYGCRLIGIDPEDVGYIVLAQSLGAGSMNLDMSSVRVCGSENGVFSDKDTFAYKPDNDSLMQGDYRKIMRLSDNVEEVESCSACYGYLLPALQMLEEEGLLELLKDKICIGQGFRGKKGALGVGNCTRLFTHHLPGCPPTEGQMADFLRNYILENSHFT